MTNDERLRLRPKVQTPIGLTKPDVLAAIAAMDDLLDTQASALNNALPEPYKSTATVAQKAELLARVVMARWGGRL